MIEPNWEIQLWGLAPLGILSFLFVVFFLWPVIWPVISIFLPPDDEEESQPTVTTKRTMNESDLTEMVNAEVDDWTYQLQELGLDDALPRWVIDNLRERMLYVASAAASGRKSKSEVGS